MTHRNLLFISCMILGVMAASAQNSMITFSKNDCRPGEEITFNAGSHTGMSGKYLIWNFGDDCNKSPFYIRTDCDIAVPAGQSVKHIYQQAGIYHVTMAVSGSDGEVYSDIITVKSQYSGNPDIPLKRSPENLTEFVYNTGFENYDACPSNIGQIKLASPWYSPSPATSDYFNSCFTPPDVYAWSVDVPDNFAGSAIPINGEAYAGIATFLTEAEAAVIAPNPESAYYNYREYLQAELAAPLVAGEKYVISFAARLSSNSRVTTEIAACITTDAGWISDPSVLRFEPVITDHPKDHSDWTMVSGVFTATGNERYVTIGNFKDDHESLLVDAFPENTIVSNYGGQRVIASYYYIDKVSLQPLVFEHAERTAIVSSGHSYSDDELMVEYSVGQRVSGMIQSGDKSVIMTQGIMQPLESDSVFIAKKTNQGGTDDIDIICYPNPGNVIRVRVENPGTGHLQSILTDLHGKIVFSKGFPAKGDKLEFQINLSDYRDGIYQLEVINEANHTGHYKIIKASGN